MQPVVEQAISYLRIIPLFYGFLGMGIVTASAFQGLGRGLPALVVNMFRLGLVGIPVAVLLTRVFDSGPVGIWWALALSDFSFAIVGIIWFTLSARNLGKESALEN
jgi:Na+-driven multidrug efflux pump